MTSKTNLLVGKAKRLAVPAGALATLALGVTYLFGHNGLAASAMTTSPLDDNSVSALVSLDKAMESVTSRVAPAIVNVQVTSKGGEEEQAAGQDGEDRQAHRVCAPGFCAVLRAGRGGMQQQQRTVRSMGLAAASSSRRMGTL